MTNLPNTAATWHDQRRLISKSNIPATAKAILHAIHGFIGKNVKAWPSYERIAALISRCRSTVIKAVDWLITQGYLQRTRRWDPKTESYRSNLYTIRWEVLTRRIEPPSEIVEIPDPPKPIPERIPEGGVVYSSDYPSPIAAPDRRIGSDLFLSDQREDENSFLEDEAHWIPEPESESQQPVVQQDQPDSYSPGQTLFSRPDHQTVPARNLTPLVNDAITDPVVVSDQGPDWLKTYREMGWDPRPDDIGRLKEYPAAVHQRQIEKCRLYLASKPIRNFQRFVLGDRGLPVTANEINAAISEQAVAEAAAAARLAATQQAIAAITEVPRDPAAATRFGEIRRRLSHIVPSHPAKSHLTAGARA